MNHTQIIRRCERLYTLSKRLNITDRPDDRRDEIILEFAELCTDAGKIATRKWKADWSRLGMAIVDAHSAAVHADEASIGTMVPVGSVLALTGSLRSLAAVLGYVLDDAATAPTDEHDEAAMAAVEMRVAAQ